jgi:hypothetical protein
MDMRRKTIVLGFILAGLGGLGLFAWLPTGNRPKEAGRIPTERPADEDDRTAIRNVWETPVDPPPRGNSSLEVVVELLKPAIRVGERLPARFYLKNVGTSGVTVLGTLHNSEFGRYPLCRVEILDQDGNRQTWQPGLRCGNTNPLDPRDFHDLQPGRQIELQHEMLGVWTPSRPGTYTIRYHYDGRGKVFGAWRPFGGPMGDPPPDRHTEVMLSRLKSVAQDVVVSKPRSFEVLP